ncbi:DUF4430 domain-containing protein [Levilactobacillus tongjiangensis]|uniref:DUF4430 domain-containing protein n=1 Tax=Levilactobacillus tongjiangensis TaxID=2486023 RepID=A0ABW1SQQ6_9LACO|nr:DUF4430 domain-containing protein [Levilactobacillus tongjiangensis]
MKKKVGIMVAVVLTILTMSTALAMQQRQQGQTPLAAPVGTHDSSLASSSVRASRQSKRRQQSVAKTVKAGTSASSVRASQQVGSQSVSAKTPTTRHAAGNQKTTMNQTATVAKKKPSSTKTSQATDQVHLTVTGYKKRFYQGNLKITSKSTAFSVLQASKLKVGYQGGAAVYVSSIHGLAQNDVKVGSGWKFTVNGKYVDQSANSTRVQRGDRVHWYFTTAG